MGKNNGTGSRKGAVKNRSQTYNSKTKQYVKRDTNTGKIMSTKSTPYKGVSKDTNAKKANSNKKS